ncbi:uncharacterized protein BO80DRAFT_467100, partial [Aspergillus ibericus CBS 121593]
MTAPREQVPFGRFNYELCASLHNQIFLIAWKGSGRSVDTPFSTWWEYYQPSDELAARYHPWLVQFLQRVYYHPEAPEFFYYLEGLNRAETLIHDDFNERFDGRDCYVLLHPATGWKMGDEYGIIFDQITCKAVFAEDLDITHPICNYGRGFQPLENIYTAYLQMIAEDKVEICRAPDGQWPKELYNQAVAPIGPWRYHAYTSADVHKAAHAFQRLVQDITTRLPPRSPSSPAPSTPLPWSDPAVRLDAHILPDSFADAFCAATTATHPLPFRYIAPGIRLPTVAEFLAQPFHDPQHKDPRALALPHERPIRPTLLFLAESDDSTPTAPTLTIPNPDTCLNSHPSLTPSKGNPPPRPAGLYLTADNRLFQGSENGCRLLLPFSIGRNGWARRSDGSRMGDDLYDENDPADENFDLYQCFVNGVGPYRDVEVHRVLENWGERVRRGEWG